MDIVNAMANDAGVGLKDLKVDGGASRNNLMMQFQADILNVPVVRPTTTETTALGAAFLAGLAVGYWNSIDEIRNMTGIERIFTPSGDAETVKEKIEGWKVAVRRTLSNPQ